MLLLTCRCLNIKIQVRGTEQDFQAAKQENLTEDYIPTGFFPSEVDVEIDTKGIKQEHSYLVHRRKIGNYTVFRCLNCGLDTYSLRISDSHVIVSGEIQSDPSVIERLANCADYSSVFQMVLLNKDTQFPASMPDCSSRCYESLQSHLNSIQQQLANFILLEEAAMETRIRNYEEEQKTNFAELQVKLKEDKKKMISILLASTQYKDKVGGEKSPPRPDSGKRATDSRVSSAKKKAVSRVKSMPPTMAPLSTDEDLFDFDGFSENTDEPFYKDSSSDDEGPDDAFVEGSRVRPYEQRSHTIYSSSVPISVPAWNPESSAHWADDEELTPSEPDQIAASMQALAQSISDDNRYIFGDRPRPRLNTDDFNNK